MTTRSTAAPMPRPHASARRLRDQNDLDAAGRLVGQITVDDIVNIIQEENREDILRLAGVADEDRGSSVMFLNVGTAIDLTLASRAGLIGPKV